MWPYVYCYGPYLSIPSYKHYVTTNFSNILPFSNHYNKQCFIHSHFLKVCIKGNDNKIHNITLLELLKIIVLIIVFIFINIKDKILKINFNNYKY